MSSTVPLAILESIIRFFGVAAQPDFSAVAEVARRQPFIALFAQLQEKYEVNDQTDINEDLSFAWTIMGPARAVLRLSFVGPFAALIAEGPHGWRVVEPDAVSKGFIRDLAEATQQEGFALLAPGVLSRPLDIWDEDDRLREVQHALFVAGEDLPL
jgi:hypothetical protein